MSIDHLINKQGLFPNPNDANDDGLLAIGGSLKPEWLIEAYSCGVFPWYSDDEPILWWSPDPRMVLFPKELIISKSLRSRLRKTDYALKIDTDFRAVIEACAYSERPDEAGTWITKEMREAYLNLHKMGIAHSFEVWMGDKLAGGLYGVSIGRMFFGESMFHNERDTSKISLVHLCRTMQQHDFGLIDVQMHTEHLESMGARLMSRREYLDILNENIIKDGIYSCWTGLDG